MAKKKAVKKTTKTVKTTKAAAQAPQTASTGNHMALAGLKVIDLTTALSGPFCTMFFADYGAEVIKIETPDGEQCRTWGPLDEKSGESGFFANYNRNKKGVTLNLKTEKGLQMLYDPVSYTHLDGYMTIKMQTPCLVTCIKELNTPRYMSVKSIFECYSKPLTVLDFEALKDEPLIELDTIGLKGSPTNIFKSFTPPQKGVGVMLEGADKATAADLADRLLKKHVI